MTESIRQIKTVGVDWTLRGVNVEICQKEAVIMKYVGKKMNILSASKLNQNLVLPIKIDLHTVSFLNPHMKTLIHNGFYILLILTQKTFLLFVSSLQFTNKYGKTVVGFCSRDMHMPGIYITEDLD